MAITTQLIGKLGGADVEVIPVEGVASGGKGSSETLATIDVPAGETWLVAAIGQVSPWSTVETSQPSFYLGDEVSIQAPAGTFGLAAVATEPISFTIERNHTYGSDTFTGHAYAVKL